MCVCVCLAYFPYFPPPGALQFPKGEPQIFLELYFHIIWSSDNQKHLMPGLHLQRNRRKSAIQKIYDGRRNFNDGCVASGARLLRRLRCSTLTTGSS